MIRLSRAQVDALLDAARRHPEEEICGLIGARGGHAATLYPVPNRLHSAQRFAMDEKGQIDAFRRMREHGETLFAIYHSHPQAPPYPSPTDIAESAYPDAYFLILSLLGGASIRAFRIQGGEVTECVLFVDSEGPARAERRLGPV